MHVHSNFYLVSDATTISDYSTAVDAAFGLHYGDPFQCPTNASLWRYPLSPTIDVGNGMQCPLCVVPIPAGATLTHLFADDPAWAMNVGP